MQFGPSRNNSTSGVNVTAMNVTNTNVSADRMLPARNDERKASNAPAVTRLKPDPKVNVSVDIGEPTELYPAYRALLSGSIWCSRLLAIFSCTFQLILPVIVGLLVGNLVIRFKDGESADKTEEYNKHLNTLLGAAFTTNLFSSACEWVRRTTVENNGVQLAKYIRYDLYHNQVSKM